MDNNYNLFAIPKASVGNKSNNIIFENTEVVYSKCISVDSTKMKNRLLKDF